MPSPGWVPRESLNARALLYSATVENAAEPVVIDASTWDAPGPLVLELLASVKNLVEIEGRWQRRSTLVRNTSSIRRFAEWVGHWDDPNVANIKQPQTIQEITPGVWSAWSLHALSPGRSTAKRLLIDTALVLRASGLLTDEASERVNARKGKVELGTVEHYSDAEFHAMTAAAKRVVRQAHRRISANYADAVNFVGSPTDPPTRESVLSEMLVETYPRSKTKARLIDATHTHSWVDKRTGRVQTGPKIIKQDARRLLYPDMSEGFAAMVLLACLRGLNLSQIETACVPDRSVDGNGRVAQVSTDKPRRGPRRRFSLEVFGDDGDDSDGRWLRRIEELCDPLRHHLRLTGRPSDRLVLYFNAVGQIPRRPPGTDERARFDWLDSLPVIDFARIKRTFETRQSRESTQNTEATHLAVYLSRDPERIAEYQDRAADGITRAYQRAVSEVQLRVVADNSHESAHAVDSTFAGCLDPEHEPRTGLPCEDGFLGCLSCRNAIATRRHIPMMRYTLSVLDELRATLPAALWESRFQRAHAQLTHVVASAPGDTQSTRVTHDQKQLVRAALGLTGAEA